MMNPLLELELSDDQLEAIEKLQNGSILNGGVGSGKSRTALGYFYFKVAQGRCVVNGEGCYEKMKRPMDVYIITTAKKRNSKEWEEEAWLYLLTTDRDTSIDGVKVTIDSWNNIEKYLTVRDSFFIFDEQRVVGYGTWAKSFIKISRNNEWILLTATPGDRWADYIPVFIANGFYANKRDFEDQHVIYSRYSQFPKIDRYLNERKLIHNRDSITVKLKDRRITQRHYVKVLADYDKEMYLSILRKRWDPFDNKPIKERTKAMYLLRRVVNGDGSRVDELEKVFLKHKRVIVFYNFTYELEAIRKLCHRKKYKFTEYNGQKHEDLPMGDSWMYVVQYAAASESWNCIETDTIVFYSQTYSYKMMEQASGRIDRMNTPYIDLYYYQFVSAAPIDKSIRLSLLQKKKFNEGDYMRKHFPMLN